MTRALRIALYSPANLNVIDGSAIWVQAIAETLHVDPDARITLPLKAPERRDVITRLLRRLDRVELIPPGERRSDVVDGLTNEAALERLEALDVTHHFAVVLLRSFALCRLAAERRSFPGRLWSAYVLEPERDVRSASYRADLAAIAAASRHVLVQSEEMRACFEQLVPEAGKRLAVLPPAIPDAPATRAPEAVVPRLIYTGKFHPFYPVHELIAMFERLRRERPGLTFHVAGDKIHRPADDRTYASSLERALMGTPGLVWHGGIGRDEVEALLAEGGVALSVWARQHGPWMNDLVVSTKLLDYCSVGLPVILNRTPAQESLLGPDYPLFVDGIDEVEPLIRRLLDDRALYGEAAERCWQASRHFTYRAVHERIAPFLAAAVDPSASPRALAASFDRPKLAGTVFTLGLELTNASDRALASALRLLDRLREADERYRLLVRTPDVLDAGRAIPSALVPAVTVESQQEARSSWFRRVAFLVLEAGSGRESLGPALASGTIPLAVGEGRARDGWPAGPIDSVAAEVAELVSSERWEAERERARREGRGAAGAGAAAG